MDIAFNVFLFIIAAFLVYFLFPNFLMLVAAFGEVLCDCVSVLKTAFTDKAKEWEDIFSFFVGGDKK